MATKSRGEAGVIASQHVGSAQVLINALTVHLGTGSHFSDLPTNQDFASPDAILSQMNGLVPPRSRSATVAAVLAILTGCLWTVETAGMVSVSQDFSEPISPIHPREILAAISVVGGLSLATVIGGFGTLFRRNWARILVIVLTGPWLLFGWFFLGPLLTLPAYMRREAPIVMNAIAPAAAIAWFALLVGKKARAEFLPPPIVQIYVNLLDEGTPCSRPALALDRGNGLFELLRSEDYDPDIEHWEFLPGSFVHGKTVDHDGKPYLLAVSLGS